MLTECQHFLKIVKILEDPFKKNYQVSWKNVCYCSSLHPTTRLSHASFPANSLRMHRGGASPVLQSAPGSASTQKRSTIPSSTTAQADLAGDPKIGDALVRSASEHHKGRPRAKIILGMRGCNGFLKLNLAVVAFNNLQLLVCSLSFEANRFSKLL